MSIDLQLKLWLNNLTEIWRSEKKTSNRFIFSSVKEYLKLEPER